MAREGREERLVEAETTVSDARGVEADARAQYHEGEAEARRKLEGSAPG
jgi:hypothetical protein